MMSHHYFNTYVSDQDKATETSLILWIRIILLYYDRKMAFLRLRKIFEMEPKIVLGVYHANLDII